MKNSPFARSTRFRGRKIHLGVCGSVACYRALDLLRQWKGMDIHVSATLTAGARHFVTPLLFESLGALPVYTDMFSDAGGQDMFAHLEPGQSADCMVVAPASADALSRLAQGSAAEMLAAQALAFDGPLVVAPAMNPRMWAHAATQANVATLLARGVHLVTPGSGGTACGDNGTGRLAPLADIFHTLLACLAPQDMAGRKVMVTLGPTREQWDGVRYWSNPSSGRMGAALATCAALRGAEVTAICGPGVALTMPNTVRRVDVTSAADMFAAAKDIWPRMDVGMFTAAVADFAPVPPAGDNSQKFKKADAPDGFDIHFTPNADILGGLSRRAEQKVLAFAAETTADMAALLPLAHAKRERKGAHVLAANRVNSSESGFGTDNNSVAVVDASGREAIWPSQSKADVAWNLCTQLLELDA